MHRLAAGGGRPVQRGVGGPGEMGSWRGSAHSYTLESMDLGLFVRRNAMASAIFDLIMMNISKVLEAIFDQIEYRLAKRALRHAS